MVEWTAEQELAFFGQGAGWAPTKWYHTSECFAIDLINLTKEHRRCQHQSNPSYIGRFLFSTPIISLCTLLKPITFSRIVDLVKTKHLCRRKSGWVGWWWFSEIIAAIKSLPGVCSWFCEWFHITASRPLPLIISCRGEGAKKECKENRPRRWRPTWDGPMVKKGFGFKWQQQRSQFRLIQQGDIVLREHVFFGP